MYENDDVEMFKRANEILKQFLGSREAIYSWWHCRNAGLGDRRPVDCPMEEVYGYLEAFKR